MKLHIKYDINIACKVILQEQLEKLQLPYTITGLGEVEIPSQLPTAEFLKLEAALGKYGIEIIDDPKNVFAQKVKDAIIEMVYLDESMPVIKISAHLSEKLNKSYGYISSVFSEVTFTCIQNFIMLQKIERAKHLIIDGEETLTEIAWKLNFSSIGHFSNEFKKVTGLTPSSFQRIIKLRGEIAFKSAHNLTNPE